MRLTRFTLFGWAAILLLLIASSARAVDNVTDEERALLPKWCNYTQTERNKEGLAEYNRIISQIGIGFSHMHHYCWAQVYIMRMRKFRGGAQKNTYQGTLAISEIDYALRQTRDELKFPFRPEMLATKAQVALEIGDINLSVKTAAQLIEEWPELPQGYALLANAYMRAGKKTEAAAVFDKGATAVRDKETLAKQRAVILN